MLRWLIAIALLNAAFSVASDTHNEPGWRDWEMDVTGVGCSLWRHYYTPDNRYGHQSSGIFSGTYFSRASIRFFARTVNVENGAGAIQFELQINTVDEHIKDEQKIVRAKVGGFDVPARLQPVSLTTRPSPPPRNGLYACPVG